MPSPHVSVAPGFIELKLSLQRKNLNYRVRNGYGFFISTVVTGEILAILQYIKINKGDQAFRQISTS